MIIKENGNILTAKGIEVLCIASLTQPKPEGLMHYVKLKYPRIFKNHLEYAVSEITKGSSSMHMVEDEKILTLLYTHQIYENKIFCNYRAIEERLEYIHEVYSDKIVVVSIPNIIADGNKEHCDIVEYIIDNIYGDEYDTAIIKVFK